MSRTGLGWAAMEGDGGMYSWSLVMGALPLLGRSLHGWLHILEVVAVQSMECWLARRDGDGWSRGSETWHHRRCMDFECCLFGSIFNCITTYGQAQSTAGWCANTYKQEVNDYYGCLRHQTAFAPLPYACLNICHRPSRDLHVCVE